jgi:hypothetical protein
MKLLEGNYNGARIGKAKYQVSLVTGIAWYP